MLALDLPETEWCEKSGKIERVRCFGAFAFTLNVVKIATSCVTW
jgi:hypothetical protein